MQSESEIEASEERIEDIEYEVSEERIDALEKAILAALENSHACSPGAMEAVIRKAMDSVPSNPSSAPLDQDCVQTTCP